MSIEDPQWNSEVIMYIWDYVGLCALLFMGKVTENVLFSRKHCSWKAPEMKEWRHFSTALGAQKQSN